MRPDELTYLLVELRLFLADLDTSLDGEFDFHDGGPEIRGLVARLDLALAARVGAESWPDPGPEEPRS